MRRAVMLLTWILMPLAEPVLAQPPLAPGVRVRLWLRSPTTDSVVGEVKSTERDTVTVSLTGGAVQRVPLERLLRIETSRGSASRWADGAIAGATVGALVGLAYAVKHTRSESLERHKLDPQETWLRPGSSVSKARAITIGAVAGGGLGALIGRDARGPERWRETWSRESSGR
jgi:hypothetical protein